MRDGHETRRLLERLVADPAFRARFDRDPVGTAHAAGLYGLAEQLAHEHGRPLEALERRESRSSLAGALAAAAAEGIGLFEHLGNALGTDTAYASSGTGAEATWHVEQFGAEGTGGLPAPGTDALLHNSNVVFDAEGTADLLEGRIDPRVVSLLTELSHEHRLVISSMCSDHPEHTTGGSISNHYYGRAFDIASVDGQPVNSGNDAARRLALELSQLDPQIRPSEIGSPWALEGAAYFSDGEHQDHLHVGFDEPLDPAWQPPAVAAAPEQVVPPAPLPQDSADTPEEDDTAGDDLRADGTVDTSGDDDAEDDSDDQDAAPENDHAGDDPRADGTVDTSGDDDAEDDSEDDSDEEDANDGVGDEASDDPSDDTDDENEDETDDDSDGDSDQPGEGSNGEDANDDSTDDSSDDAPAPVSVPEAPVDPGDYPGDDAPPEQIAAWLAAGAQDRGLPPELPVMAALVESGMKNIDYGDADSVGLFQMRSSVWNGGGYAGYADDPELQLKWFLDRAEAVKADRVAAGLPVDDPAHYGDWIADVERPAEEFRGRYQLHLADAQQLLGGLPTTPEIPAAGANDAQVFQVPDDSSP